ncbi:MAG TPA: 16S rRNA (adenine(1518)-N(6)/adenine(1519)-N(6))-dimethyltransferase RsmA [Syntrophomonadaceae bacterium]|nr:16S rRNA (adenine(1518)-N(6)/adenine(1519)-N(6))-dimethyltransferase RsmA [Syntrophomonadaceae bacterium]
MSPATLSDVHRLLNKYDLHPQKRWGQNFLVDKNILNKITDAAGLNENEYVLEIGPGLGALTRRMAARSKGVLAVDIDRKLQGPLEEMVGNLPQVHLLFHDVLTIDLEEELRKAFNTQELHSFSLCANIPYNITSPIIFKILDECPSLRAATLMIQKEVAQRITAQPGTKDYGRLTLSTAYRAQVRHLMNVSHNCFYPKPEVDSTVIQLIPHQTKPVAVKDEALFKGLMRIAFQKRRKTILNICVDYFQENKETAKEILDEVQISSTNRPENLGLKEFAVLADAFSR